jgi:hypothetical protein
MLFVPLTYSSDAKVAAGKGLLSGHITFEMKGGVERIDSASSAMVLSGLLS